jgi:hypothetical protein
MLLHDAAGVFLACGHALHRRSWRGTSIVKALFLLMIAHRLSTLETLAGVDQASTAGVDLAPSLELSAPSQRTSLDAEPTRPRQPGPFRVAIFEHDAKHTEIMGVFLSWAKARSAQVTLFVGDDTYRSFVPLYRRVFGAAVGGPLVDVLPPSKLAEAFETFDVTIFATAAPDKNRPFPIEVLKLQKHYPRRCVYVVHHVEAPVMVPRWWQSRLISLTPLLASPFLTPGFLDADDRWEDGPPRLRLSQRHRALCMIGTGANDRYESEDIDAFFRRQLTAAAAPARGSLSPPAAGTQLVRRTAHHTESFSFRHGVATILAASAGSQQPSSPSRMLLRLGDVDWDPATLKWWWPPNADDVTAGATTGRVPRAAPSFVRQLLLGSSLLHGRDVKAAAERNAAARLPEAVSSALLQRLDTASAGDVQTTAATLRGLLQTYDSAVLINDARPIDAVTAHLYNSDVRRAMGALRRCAFLLVHPRPGAREMQTRMTGALPTAFIARTPLLVPQAFASIYNLTDGAAMVFNSSLAEVEAALLAMDDDAYDRILDAFDGWRRARAAASFEYLDDLLLQLRVDNATSRPWRGFDVFGPGWWPRQQQL